MIPVRSQWGRYFIYPYMSGSPGVVDRWFFCTGMHTIHPVEDCAANMWWFGTYLKDHPTNRKWLVTLVSKSPKSQHLGCDYGYEPLTKWDDLPSRMTFFFNLWHKCYHLLWLLPCCWYYWTMFIFSFNFDFFLVGGLIHMFHWGQPPSSYSHCCGFV